MEKNVDSSEDIKEVKPGVYSDGYMTLGGYGYYEFFVLDQDFVDRECGAVEGFASEVRAGVVVYSNATLDTLRSIKLAQINNLVVKKKKSEKKAKKRRKKPQLTVFDPDHYFAYVPRREDL